MKANKRRTPQLHKRRAALRHRRERWDAILSGIIDMSRVLSSNLDIDTIWDALHDHVNLTFETTSFFVAVYDYERDRLALPLVSEDGLRVRRAPIPVCGMSRAVMLHGLELYVQDAEVEQPRLQALGIEPDEREPGCWARAWIGVPLRSRQSEVIGLIALQNLLPGSLTDRDLSLLMALAAPLSLALDNIRLVENERERRLIAGALMEIGQLAGAQLDYDDVLDRVLDQLQRVISYDSAAVLLPTSDDQRTLIVSASHDPDVFPKGGLLRYADFSPLAKTWMSQQPFLVADADDFAAWWEGDRPPAAHLRSWLIVPMPVQGKVGGVIVLGKFAPSDYTQKDASSAFALARQGAIALETTRLHAQAQTSLEMFQQRARRLASINRITSVITSSLDRDEVFKTTAQLLAELFEANHCGIMMVEQERGEIVLAAEYPDTGSTGTGVRIAGNTTMNTLVYYGTAVSIEDAEDSGVDDPTRDSLRRIGARSTLIAPLIVRDRLIGTISIDMTSARRRFSDDEREMLVMIAGQVAIAVSHADLYEDALALSRLRSAFLANISHELRTPLNAIIGYSDMLLSEFYGTLNEQQRDRVNRVNSSGKHLLTMIDGVLDLSKLEAGQITLARLPLYASDVLNEVVDEIAPSAQEKNLTLEIGVSPDELPARADRQYLRQVISNLLRNAVKFTRSGGVRVDLLTVAFDSGVSPQIAAPDAIIVPDGDWIALRVSDTGIGIKKEDQGIIFESFRQVDSSTARQYGGSGLGLAITRRVVELHEGYIWVESEIDVGSTFTVLLPTVKPGLIDDFDLDTVRRDQRPLVLVVDDGPADRKLMQDYLGETDFQVICTANSTAVLDIARQLQPDVVITDVMMPEATGWDVLRVLKGDHVTARIPVIVLSVLDQKMLGLGLGAADYLVKPVDRETLRGQVQRALENARAS
ncbi:MAG: GAF domain-containing protein [Anaerolineae bacterium]